MAGEPTATTAPRVTWLDGIRGAAAVFVVLHHMWLAIGPATPRTSGRPGSAGCSTATWPWPCSSSCRASRWRSRRSVTAARCKAGWAASSAAARGGSCRATGRPWSCRSWSWRPRSIRRPSTARRSRAASPSMARCCRTSWAARRRTAHSGRSPSNGRSTSSSRSSSCWGGGSAWRPRPLPPRRGRARQLRGAARVAGGQARRPHPAVLRAVRPGRAGRGSRGRAREHRPAPARRRRRRRPVA